MKARVVLLAGLCIAAALRVAAAEEEGRFFHVYPLGFVEVEVAEAAAKEIVGAGGAVVPDRRQQRLLVRATEEEHRRLTEALIAINRPPRNIRIDVDLNETSATRRRGIGAAAAGRDGQVSIGLGFQDTATRSSGRVRQTLVVASGREAVLRVGERVPWIEWIEEWGRRAGVFEAQVRWEDVGAFLAVEPTLIGDGPDVRIRLIPELSGRVEGRPHRIRYVQAATEVIARLGETISLAGLGQKNEFFSRFLVGFSDSGDRQSLNMTLTPTLVGPSPALTPGLPASPNVQPPLIRRR
jgi:hypothetical protein